VKGFPRVYISFLVFLENFLIFLAFNPLLSFILLLLNLFFSTSPHTHPQSIISNSQIHLFTSSFFLTPFLNSLFSPPSHETLAKVLPTNLPVSSFPYTIG